MKLIRAFLLLLLINMMIIPAHAQDDEPPIPAPPANDGYILDELDWLTSEQEASITKTVHRLDLEGIAEIAVVTLNDCGSDKQSFRKSLFDTWGIGHKDDNDGLLILVCWYDGDRSLRSVEQLYGPGLNGILTSEQTDQIVHDEFLPPFRLDKPGEGLVGMVRSYNLLLRTAKTTNNSPDPVVQFFKNMDEGVWAILLLLVIVALRLGFERFLPKSVRELFPRDRDSDSGNDRGGFDGGRSDGGGGSSTRF